MEKKHDVKNILIPAGMTLKKVFNRNRIVLQSFTVKDILGLDATVEFDSKITNLTSLNSMGRTRFLKCLDSARIMALNPDMYDAQPNELYGKVNASSKMSLTLRTAEPDDLDFTIRLDFSFTERTSDRTGDVYYINHVVWNLFDKDGKAVCYDGTREAEDVDEFYDIAMAEVRDFLKHGLIMSMDEAMRHLGRLPDSILGVIGVHDESDISENIGRLIPWLCVFADDCDRRTVILDDVFDSIHPCVVTNFTEHADSVSRHCRRQMVMSCRRVEGLDADSPCHIFHDGRAVKISKEERARLYVFDGEGEYTSWIKHVENGDAFQMVKDIFEEAKE